MRGGAPSGMADAEDFLDCLEQVFRLKRLGEHETRSVWVHCGAIDAVTMGTYTRGLVADWVELPIGS